jgi:3-oxoacyl-[acyl-carrier-protein] synthase II
MSIFYDAQGPNNSITAGEASATLAMGEAFRALERGSADIFIAGGCDSKTNPLSVLRMALLNRLSRRQTAPEEASRPFDVERDGMVVGEGAGLLIFEELEHSVRRGANIWAEVIGFGASCNPGRHQLAIEKAVTRALKDASVSPAELGHVVPHGCSCVEDDRIEAMALAGVLGDARETTPVVGYKSYFGSLTAAGGAVELIASLLGMKNGVLPSTLNTRRQEAEAPKLRILGEPTEFSKKPFLTYDLSHSGQCAALVVRPFEG